MKISFSNSAFKDLEDIKSYYAGEGVPTIGKRFIAEIIKHIENLKTHPEIGRIVPEFDDIHMRELIHPPFRIVYLLEDNAIKIIRVWRSERLLKIPNQSF